MKNFNFFDVLNALVMLVFQDAHTKEWQERQDRINKAIEIGNADELRLIDKIQKGDDNYWELEVME